MEGGVMKEILGNLSALSSEKKKELDGELAKHLSFFYEQFEVTATELIGDGASSFAFLQRDESQKFMTADPDVFRKAKEEHENAIKSSTNDEKGHKKRKSDDGVDDLERMSEKGDGGKKACTVPVSWEDFKSDLEKNTVAVLRQKLTARGASLKGLKLKRDFIKALAMLLADDANAEQETRMEEEREEEEQQQQQLEKPIQEEKQYLEDETRSKDQVMEDESSTTDPMPPQVNKKESEPPTARLSDTRPTSTKSFIDSTSISPSNALETTTTIGSLDNHAQQDVDEPTVCSVDQESEVALSPDRSSLKKSSPLALELEKEDYDGDDPKRRKLSDEQIPESPNHLTENSNKIGSTQATPTGSIRGHLNSRDASLLSNAESRLSSALSQGESVASPTQRARTSSISEASPIPAPPVLVKENILVSESPPTTTFQSRLLNVSIEKSPFQHDAGKRQSSPARTTHTAQERETEGRQSKLRQEMEERMSRMSTLPPSKQHELMVLQEAEEMRKQARERMRSKLQGDKSGSTAPRFQISASQPTKSNSPTYLGSHNTLPRSQPLSLDDRNSSSSAHSPLPVPPPAAKQIMNEQSPYKSRPTYSVTGKLLTHHQSDSAIKVPSKETPKNARDLLQQHQQSKTHSMESGSPLTKFSSSASSLEENSPKSKIGSLIHKSGNMIRKPTNFLKKKMSPSGNMLKQQSKLQQNAKPFRPKQVQPVFRNTAAKPFTQQPTGSSITSLPQRQPENTPGSGNTLQRPGESDTTKFHQISQNEGVVKAPVPPAQEWRAENNYEISDKEDSESSDDDEREPRKMVPEWAQKKGLTKLLQAQYFGVNRPDPDDIFGEIPACDLEAIFKQTKSRYKQRGSSGYWAKDGLTVKDKRQYRKDIGLE